MTMDRLIDSETDGKTVEMLEGDGVVLVVKIRQVRMGVQSMCS